MPKQVVCGIGKVGKNQKLGSMKECAEKKQIRYWGVNKVDPKILELAKKGSKRGESRKSIILKMVGLRGKLTKLRKEIAATKDKKEKDKLEKKKAKFEAELEVVAKKFEKIEKEKNKKGGSRRSRTSRGSRKGSRRGSKKGSRRTSRKGSKRTSRKGSRRGSRKN